MAYSALEMADAFIKAGELQDALDVLNQHLSSVASSNTIDADEAYRLRAELLLRLPGEGHLQKALADFDALSTCTPDDEMRRSVIFERMDNLAAALDSAQKAYRARADDERFAERTLQLLMTQGKLDEAAAMLETLPDTWRWQQWHGDVAAAREDWQSARESYQAALGSVEQILGFVWVDGVKARLHLALADVCIHLSDYQQSNLHYITAETFIPDDPMIPFNRGLLCALQGDTAQAVHLCRAAYANANANETLRAHMASTLRDDARYIDIKLEGDE
jgi:tetratricopeptide (TPR) repeat protein